MSNKIPFISANRQPDEQGDIDNMKFNYHTFGEHLEEASDSNAAPTDDTSPPDNNNCASIETELTISCVPEDGDDRLLLIEDSVPTSRSVMASSGPPPPPPPPSFGSMKPQPPSTPPPSPPLSPSLPLQLDKAVQSPPLSADFPLRCSEFARTVNTFFKEPQSHRNNEENSADRAVQTAALVHAEDPEVTLCSLAVPLALAAPCRSKPRRYTPSSSYERRRNSQCNGQISHDDSDCAAAGDAPSVAISSAGSSSPRYAFEDFNERLRRNSREDEPPHEDSCMESCVYYSVKCCECIVM